MIQFLESQHHLEPDYPHVTVVQDFEPASLSLVRYLRDDLPLGKLTQGDPLDALIVGLDLLLAKAPSHKKYNRKIFLITDAGKTPISSDGSDRIIEKMKEINATFDIM